MITGDASSDVKFLLIILSIIIVPALWVMIRGNNSTDHEEREKPPMELAEPATVKAGYPGIDYKLVPVHQPNPDYYSYKKILDKQEAELKKKLEEDRRKQ